MSLYREPPWTVGIEEEYLLVDKETRDLADPPEQMLKDFETAMPEHVRPEFLRSQVEVGTSVCDTVGEAKSQLRDLRKLVAEIAGNYGLAPIAASTHPFAQWEDLKHTDKARYHMLAKNLQAVARRLVISGMHVHVGIEDEELRIDLMNQVTYFLPHLLALSTSSPFWRGEDTGLKSYRLAIFSELPRTGLPQSFASYQEYSRHVKVLEMAGLIDDASMIWWDVRPSIKFPTLEMRITDVCTRLDHAAAIAALYVCILRMLYRLRRSNQRWRQYAHMLIEENRWRAQRYGMDEGLVDFGKGEIVSCAHLLDELLDMVKDDAEALGCTEEIMAARQIIENGTSAHLQQKKYNSVRKKGGSHEDALKGVVDCLTFQTLDGL